MRGNIRVNGGSPAIETSVVEREITEAITAAKIRLRFDKSVVRLIDGLRAALAETVPERQAVVFTVTAPIRRRAKTAAALESLVRDALPNREARATIQENHIGLCLVTRVPTHMPKVLGFVHNLESDAGLILAIAKSRLLGRN